MPAVCPSLVTAALGLGVSAEGGAVKSWLWGAEMLWIFITCLLSPNVTVLWQEFKYLLIDFTLVSGTGLQQPWCWYPALIWTLAMSVWTLLCLAGTQARGDLAGEQLW